MRSILLGLTLLVLGLTATVSPAAAVDSVGSPATLFVKSQLGPGSTVGDTLSLSDYPGRVVLLFLFEPN